MSKNEQGNAGANPEHIDQIREIIFGPQKKELDDRLSEIETNVRDLSEKLDAAIATLSKNTDDALARLRSLLSALETKNAQDSESLTGDLNNVRNSIVQKLTALEKQLAEELHRQLAGLDDKKISRETMADLLSALSEEVRGQNEISDQPPNT